VRYEYDDQNNRTLVVDELGLATRTIYNANNDPVQITDPQGNTAREDWGSPIKRPLVKEKTSPSKKK
jgi:hypothetical protein